MVIVTLSKIGKAFDEHTPLFSDVSFNLLAGERVALIGANGAGKTTLLRMIAGLDSLDDSRAITSGSLRASSRLTVGYLAQDADADLPSDESLLLAVSRATPELRAAADEMARLESRLGSAQPNPQSPFPNRDGEHGNELHAQYARALGHFENLGGYDYERHATEVLLRLGFCDDDLRQPVRVLSGGQKTRAALARLLLAEPDLLLLDEPTNHLDIAACEWLQEFLVTYRGAALIVSHDRYFLDHVAQKVIVLAHGTAAEFAGNYSQTASKRAALREAQAKQHELQQREIERMEEMVTRLRRWAGKGGSLWGQVFSKEKTLEKLKAAQTEAPRADPRAMKLRAQTHARSGNEVLTVQQLFKQYSQTSPSSLPEGILRIISDPSSSFSLTVDRLLILRGQRIGVVGPNGSGKTTLLKMLAGLEAPTDGTIRIGTNVKLAYFRQDFSHLRSELTVLEELVDVTDLTAHEARTLLAKYLFTGEDVFKPVDVLSGGERCRLSLAKLLLEKPNLLLLDEPTNHLDIVSREALEDALREFTGTLLVASHDRYLLDALATRILEVRDGTVRVFNGDYSEYAQHPGDRQTVAGAIEMQGKLEARHGKAGNREAQRAAERAERAQRRQRIGRIEKEIAMLETQLSIVGAVFANPDTYRSGNAKGAKQEYEELSARLNQLHREWEQLAEER